MNNAPNIYLAQWRLAQGLSQAVLAQRSGLAQPAISRLERRGRGASLGTLTRLADVLGISPGDLLIPPPHHDRTLSRTDADAIARAVVSGERLTDPRHQQLADAVAHLVSQQLAAAGAPGRLRNRGWRWSSPRRSLAARHRFGDPCIRQILHRVQRLLTATAFPDRGLTPIGKLRAGGLTP